MDKCLGSLLAGGPDDDVLQGSLRSDVLIGDGNGPPPLAVWEKGLADPGGGNDRIDGGLAGSFELFLEELGASGDIVSYAGRSDGVRVNLADRAPDGGPGELDRITGVEHVIGGDGHDVLFGTAGDNVLYGASGDDRLVGRAGDDLLRGFRLLQEQDVASDVLDGRDTIIGGAGDDILDPGGHRGDVLSGGPGQDVIGVWLPLRGTEYTARCGSGRDIVGLALVGRLLADCEVLELYYARLPLRPRRRQDGKLRFSVRHDGDSSVGAELTFGCCAAPQSSRPEAGQFGPADPATSTSDCGDH